jgi:hypothetical protein
VNLPNLDDTSKTGEALVLDVSVRETKETGTELVGWVGKLGDNQLAGAPDGTQAEGRWICPLLLLEPGHLSSLTLAHHDSLLSGSQTLELAPVALGFWGLQTWTKAHYKSLLHSLGL